MAELDRNKVKELYIDKKMSIAKCAREFGVSSAKMNKFLIDEGLKVGMSCAKSDVKDLSNYIKPTNNTIKTESNESNESKPKKAVKKSEDKKEKVTRKSSRPAKRSSVKQQKSKPNESKEISIEDKIIYCNNKYGRNRWRFMDRDELREALMEDLGVEVEY